MLLETKIWKLLLAGLGQNSTESFEYVLKYKGKLNKNEDYENIVIKASTDGSMLRLKDVARVEFGSYT